MTIIIEKEVKVTGTTFYNIRIDGEYKTSFNNEEDAVKHFNLIKENYLKAKIEILREETI